eukprot:289945-Prorocentrum_lima.AAC.1
MPGLPSSRTPCVPTASTLPLCKKHGGCGARVPYVMGVMCSLLHVSRGRQACKSGCTPCFLLGCWGSPFPLPGSHTLTSRFPAQWSDSLLPTLLPSKLPPQATR